MKILWFLAFVFTGAGLLVRSLLSLNNINEQVALILIGFLFLVGLTSHFKEFRDRGNQS